MAASMDTLGIEPRASRMLSGCDTTAPRALLVIVWRSDCKYTRLPKTKRSLDGPHTHVSGSSDQPSLVHRRAPTCWSSGITGWSRSHTTWVFAGRTQSEVKSVARQRARRN